MPIPTVASSELAGGRIRLPTEGVVVLCVVPVALVALVGLIASCPSLSVMLPLFLPELAKLTSEVVRESEQRYGTAQYHGSVL